MPAGQVVDIGRLKMSEWISVDDISGINDDNCDDYFWVTDGVNVERGWYDNTDIFMCVFSELTGNITHWMSITVPEPPK